MCYQHPASLFGRDVLNCVRYLSAKQDRLNKTGRFSTESFVRHGAVAANHLFSATTATISLCFNTP